MNKIQASIITIGDELLIGQTIDTNSAYIAQELNKIGVWVKYRIAVGDNYNDIWTALDQESNRSQIVIITGGLGPTADDITKPLLCDYFKGTLIRNQEVLAHIQHLFETVYKRPGGMLERNRKQADVPDNCNVLHNSKGTAPGMHFIKDGVHFFSLPGVPQEMKDIIQTGVIPTIEKSFERPFILHKTTVTAGMGESMVAERLIGFEAQLPSFISLAYLPSYGMVKLRLTATGVNQAELNNSLEFQQEKLKTILVDILVADEDETIEVTIGKLLSSIGKTIGTAESCTGGKIATLLTAVAGSSKYFKGSIVSYANQVKEDVLHVNNGTISSFGAVSSETVTEMAKGAIKALNTDYIIATSGIMGPSGGTKDKPVGTVWIALASKEKVETHQLNLRFDRARNISITANSALNLMRKFINSNP
jgi:nicotinamide-nucleotide amidase